MKLKKDLILREMAGMWVVVAVGAASVDFGGMLTLNESGMLLWKALEQGADHAGLVKTLTDEYEVDDATASADVDRFLTTIREAGCLEEN